MLARMDQARELVMSDVNLSTVVNESVTSALAAGPDHPITTDIAHEVHTQGDADKIHQIITNLLANARAHTPTGTKIHVAAYADEHGSYVTVADQGPGLTTEDQTHIFERFYRVDSSRQRSSQEGSGLGLSIVDEVMKAHGGTVSVASEPGNGATFTLHFKVSH
jgi:two-component system OmpR family sensor kinase